MKGLFGELGMQTIEAPAPKILEDNNGVVLRVNVNVNVDGTGSNPSNTKSVDIKEKYVQNRVQKGEIKEKPRRNQGEIKEKSRRNQGEIKVEYFGTEDNFADTFTKPLSYVAFGRHFPYLGFDKQLAIRMIAIR